MARPDRVQRIVPSLLDRLLDDRPEQSHEAPESRFYDVREQKKSVARDLEELLNSRQESLWELPPEFAAVRKSLPLYGLPDFSSYNLLSPDDRNRLQRAIESTITSFEQRLQRVRVTMNPPSEKDRALHFKVEALLRVDPIPEPVAFDTLLHLSTQEYSVQDKD
jgi:type VI secretion system protein ImpF